MFSFWEDTQVWDLGWGVAVPSYLMTTEVFRRLWKETHQKLPRNPSCCLDLAYFYVHRPPQTTRRDVGGTDSVHENLTALFPAQFFIGLVGVSAVDLHHPQPLSKHPHCLWHLSFPRYPQIRVQQRQSK